MMNVAQDAPKRPALRYYGGKWRLAPWIISFFPEHKNYVEPCGGAASVLLQKPRSPLETYNDLDGNVVNFFRVLRDRPDELIRKIRLTPWAREEYELSRESDPDPVEMARRFICASWMSISGSYRDTRSGMHIATDRRTYYSLKNFSMPGYDDLMPVAERMLRVQIENRPALNLIERFDNDAALFYFDPPYVQDTRAQPETYLLEWSDDDHFKASVVLRQAQGFVVVSGYACDLYTELYEVHGWQRHDKEAQTNSGGKRIESVWLSPRTVAALDLPEQGRLF
jgi:DNA adenine methylase